MPIPHYAIPFICLPSSVFRTMRSPGISSACLLLAAKHVACCEAAFTSGPCSTNCRVALSPAPLVRSSLRECRATRVVSFRRAAKLNDDDDSKKEMQNKTETTFTLDEIARIEEEASGKVWNRLLLPDRIGKAINFAAWFFVISSFVLEAMGYGYVPRDGGGLTIDTLDNRAFILEMRRSMKEVIPPPSQI